MNAVHIFLMVALACSWTGLCICTGGILGAHLTRKERDYVPSTTGSEQK